MQTAAFQNAVEGYLCSAVSGFRRAGKPETKGSRRKRAEERCEKAGIFYRDEIVPAMEALRAPVDALEMKVDRSFWPMPGYADLLFEV